MNPQDGEAPRAAALVIGNELLSGKVPDENVVVLARTLRRCGVLLDRVVMVRDELDVMVSELRTLSGARRWVFTSGGVGPTHDDLTIDAVAAAFDVDVVTAPAIESLLRGHYGDEITDGHLRMARVPEGARLVRSATMPWPSVVMENVWILPGVPKIFEIKMQLVVQELGARDTFQTCALHTHLDEGPLKPHLDAIVSDHPGVEVGSYPRWDEPRFKTKVTFDAPQRSAAEAARAALLARLPPSAVADVPEDA